VNRIAQVDRIVGTTSEVYRDQFLIAFNELVAEEPEAALVSPLSGSEIIQLLNIEPGPLVGRIRVHLEALAVETGPLTRDQAAAAAREYLEEN
jgi:hypothetical protein